MIPLESSCQFTDEDLTTATKEMCFPLQITPESWYSYTFYMIIRKKNYNKILPLKVKELKLFLLNVLTFKILGHFI